MIDTCLQEDFIWQEIWQTFIHLFKVGWNDHLVNYFPLMYRYRINTNITAFNIFSCRILVILYKTLIITGISNEITNELTTYGILCWNVTVFYQQELASLFQVQEKLKACGSSKLNFSSSCFIADDSHVKIIWLRIVVFSEHDIWHFWDNIHLFKYYPVIPLILSITQIKPVYKFSNFRWH